MHEKPVIETPLLIEISKKRDGTYYGTLRFVDSIATKYYEGYSRQDIRRQIKADFPGLYPSE